MIETVFKNTIKKYRLLEPKDKVLLGVSGGPDSLCLLHLFLKIKKEYSLKLICVHFNHRLRQEALLEENFVKDVCKAAGVEFISEGKNVKDFAGDSLEQAARNLRFDFFLKVSRQTKFKKLALAHHCDDLVETVLMRLIRGSGLRGLSGFSPQMRFRSLKVIRPLIELSKDDILAWLSENKISYCLDQSNFQEEFFRNRIRLKLMPLLKELNPNIVENISNAARNISLDYSFIYDYSYQVFLSLKTKESSQSLYLNLKKLKNLPLAIFSNVIRIAIEELKGSTRRLTAKHIDELADLVANRPSGSIVDLPFLLAKKEQNHLRIQSLIL
ncbi:MAG: tRNA lysidine(34) synthetase TilS [Candidatus Omnitrophica bacterium]|nr:tRNA lysidine(34) synthetase TilS [Candidatus Omnitrophota bacterium]MBU2266000.1 tRNA lysidine(34) synthetase TilS [Candidatus Omnitrophota bacterium]MBU2474020.1 tRNA lysidine(34) synthetase TilS [Candidatus Omnitrophota bacterium]